MNRFKYCPNGHYYPENLGSCPYCESKSKHIRCSCCGWLNPIENQRCEKCGTVWPANAHQEGPKYKLCPNGHYYDNSLTECPYCKIQGPPSPIGGRDPMRTALFCPICGEELDHIAAKCHNCGVTGDWKRNDNIDIECAHLYPNDCNIDRLWNDAVGRYRRWLVDFKIEAPAPSDPLLIEWYIVLHNDIVHSEWYRAMHAYIDAYTRKIIERHHCYKYGLAHLDEQTQKLSLFEGDDYFNIFCEVKSIIIHQDYGLLWFTPQVLKRELCPHCDTVFNSDKDTCLSCGLSREWKYNDNIDPECKEWFPEFCTIGGPYHKPAPSEIAEKLHRHREYASISGIDNSEWYALMQMYIDEYTFKIIERKQCYKYGLPELDDNKENVKLNHIFWKLKKAIIKQDYGLNWLTPEEHFEEVRTGYISRT